MEKKQNLNNDQKIIEIAKATVQEFKSEVDIITYDTGFSARLSGIHGEISVLFLADYIIKKQKITDMQTLKKIDQYYANSYEDMDKKIGIQIPNVDEINAYLDNGYTLIISIVRNRKISFHQRCEKIKWLIHHGADINKRDCSKYYFPALSHSIQNNDFKMFTFLLDECKANPNIGSRNPFESGKFYQKDKNKKQGKNEGNMPLMIAAWDNKIEFVKALCKDQRISLNQQDANGFTALIKACYRGHEECRAELLRAGADRKIVDRDGLNANDYYQKYLKNKKEKNRQIKNKKKGDYGD